MNSHWFKFYGQDWLTDTKLIKMSVEDRLCFLTLLCLASSTDDGVINNCDEEALIQLTHLYNDPYETPNEYTRAQGCLQRFGEKGMITNDNAGSVTVVNFLKRQGSNLTGYERVKKFRENHKDKPKEIPKVINDNVNDNGMITSDKIRVDKIKEDNSKESSRFAPPTLPEVSEYINQMLYGLDPEEFLDKNTATGWIMNGGKKVKDWKAHVRNWEKMRKKWDAEKNPFGLPELLAMVDAYCKKLRPNREQWEAKELAGFKMGRLEYKLQGVVVMGYEPDEYVIKALENKELRELLK